MIASVLLVAVLLAIGVALRQGLKIFQLLYIPASVIAGAIGLLILQAIDATDYSAVTQPWVDTMRPWPKMLIAVVFAGMLLERKPAPVSESLSRVGRQGLMVWVIVLGQTAIGLLATWLLVQPFYDVPNSAGMLIETGMAGGHGTASAMGAVYEHPTIDFSAGSSLGVLMATCGLVYGIVSGILWVNIGVRLGWVQRQRPAEMPPSGPGGDQLLGSPIGYARISGETIDPLLLQIVWLALAFGVGVALHDATAASVGYLEQWSEVGSAASEAERQLSQRMSLRNLVDGFPLFIYTLFGGLLVRWMLRAARHEDAIDRDTINRLTATAMDILVVSAIATLDLTAVFALIVPFAILLACGAVWSGVCLLVISRWMLPRGHWFELGLINYGMSTGTTATGFVLLRLVDPELESGAAEDYALAAPLSSPFIGGGMITIGLPLLVLERVPIALTAITVSAMVIAMILVGRRWNAHDG